MAGGPTVNLLIAFVIFLGRLRHLRQPERRPASTPLVAEVEACVVPVERGRPGLHAPTDPVTPAVKAGLQEGDRIVAFNGTAITDWKQLQDADPRQRRRHAPTIAVRRDGRELVLTTNTTVTLRPTSATDET